MNIITKIENFLLVLCQLTDNSFFKLFFMYFLMVVCFDFLAMKFETYLGFENKVRLYDFIYILIVFAIFAWNCSLLSKIKLKEGKMIYTIRETE